jgi:UPF0042 nucleotide-binding protein
VTDTTPVPELMVVTGMSGAGRTTAGDVLEDLGWFVIDNLPPALLPTLVDLGSRTHGDVARIAAVVDVRGRPFSTDLRDSFSRLRQAGLAPRILFLDASDEVLVRRFEASRRTHPLQADGRVLDGIAAERALLGDLKGDADLVLDTTGLNVHQLRAAIEQHFAGVETPGVQATVISFGFKYGLPVDADFVLDCRFLPNPYWVPELRAQTGLDPQVSEYVLGQQGAREAVDAYDGLLRQVVPGFEREGKRFITLALGCTGGKHRSVAITEAIAERLRALGVPTRVVHRDLGRE